MFAGYGAEPDCQEILANEQRYEAGLVQELANCRNGVPSAPAWDMAKKLKIGKFTGYRSEISGFGASSCEAEVVAAKSRTQTLTQYLFACQHPDFSDGPMTATGPGAPSTMSDALASGARKMLIVAGIGVVGIGVTIYALTRPKRTANRRRR